MSWFSNSNSESPSPDKSSELRQMERNLARDAMRAMATPAPASSSAPAAGFGQAARATASGGAASSGFAASTGSAAGTLAPTSVLGPTLRFRGELRADEDFTLQGRIEGAIHHSRNLTIGAEGSVKGDSRAQNIVVEGSIEGDLYALESISVRSTAKITGNLYAPRVAIADGATFNGKVDMVSSAKAARSVASRMQESVLNESQVIDALSGS